MADRAQVTPFEEAVGIAVMWSSAYEKFTVAEVQEIVERVGKSLLSLPVEQRMEAMGMVSVNVVADDGETLDVWIERGDETDGGY